MREPAIVVGVVIGLLASMLSVSAGAEGVRFATAPTAERAGDGAKISFAVSAPTDVEISILKADDKVVRHLAAGVLGGKKAPPPPLKAGLAQELTWDGTDDAGRRVDDPAACKVRVRAGLSVKFGRIIGASPYTGRVTTGAPSDSLAVDDQGKLYVKMGSFVPQLHQVMPWQIRKFDRAGKYVRTLLPYPPSTDPDKATAFKLIDAGDGLLTPASLTPLDPALLNLGNNICRRLVDGRLVFVAGGSARLHFVSLDGSGAIRTVPMRTRPDKLKWAKWLSPQVAFSPDGKHAYYSNVAATPYDGKKPADIDPKFPQGRVYRHDLSRDGTDPEPFFDLTLPDWQKKKYWMPSAWDKKTAAAGIDVDAKGNVLVGDLVNQQVVEINPQGKQLSATPVPWPDKVLVHRTRGTLYVVSRKISRGKKSPATLLKIVGRGESAKVVARLPLKGLIGQTLALDDSGESPVLWLGGGADLVRVEDRGEALVVVDSILNRDKDAIQFVCYSDVDPAADLVYVTHSMGPVWRFDGQTGKGGLTPIRAVDLAVGPKGMIYAWGRGRWAGPVVRYTRDFKPAPLKSGKNTYGNLSGRYGRGNSVCGLDVDVHGRVFAAWGGNSCHVRVYDADGQLVSFDRQAGAGRRGEQRVPAAVTKMDGHGGSIRVDNQGNIYVLQIGLPKGFTPPKGFERDPAYLRCTGTIHRFGPEGGQFKAVHRALIAPVGAKASYPGCAPLSGRWSSTGSVCVCTKPRFDVDGFGRLYIPNAFTYKVSVVDNAGNPIISFGGYGNFDAAGPGSAEPKPEIPLGWPITAGASDRYIYIGDCLNHRVLRADKVFAAEADCKVK